MTCAILAFIYTYLDPFAWWTRLRTGEGFEDPGHVRDIERSPRYRIIGDRECSFDVCARCGREYGDEWRPAWRRA